MEPKGAARLPPNHRTSATIHHLNPQPGTHSNRLSGPRSGTQGGAATPKPSSLRHSPPTQFVIPSAAEESKPFIHNPHHLQPTNPPPVIPDSDRGSPLRPKPKCKDANSFALSRSKRALARGEGCLDASRSLSPLLPDRVGWHGPRVRTRIRLIIERIFWGCSLARLELESGYSGMKLYLCLLNTVLQVHRYGGKKYCQTSVFAFLNLTACTIDSPVPLCDKPDFVHISAINTRSVV